MRPHCHFDLLTLKPVIYAANLDEDGLSTLRSRVATTTGR